MQEGALSLFPKAKGGFLAMKRDEQTFKATLYYERLPDIKNKSLFLLDPMVATGGSLSDAIDVVKKHSLTSITTLNIIAAPEGIAHITSRHLDITMHIAQIDERLNEEKFIIPGLGDARDRAFNT